MRTFAEVYPDEQFVQEVLAQITWYHHITLLEKVKDEKARLWYIQQAIEHGWSRNILVMQIETGLFQRKGKALTNFKHTLPTLQSDLAHDAFQFTTSLPDALKEQLPTIEDLEAQLKDVEEMTDREQV